MNDCLPALLNSIAQGDESAFANLYRQYRHKLTVFSYTILQNHEASEEVVEDVFLNIWKNRGAIHEIENLQVYLYVSVKNRSLSQLSKKANDLITMPFDFIDFEISGNVVNPQDMMINQELLNCMQQAIQQLPPRCKMIFKLVREDGLKYKEVAKILNISVNTIDVQMAIAIKRICQSMNLQKPKKTGFSFLQKNK